MTPHQRIVAAVLGFALFILIVELVRRRKLKEEFSLLWMITGIGVAVLSIWFDAVRAIQRVVGAEVPVSALFFFGLLFLVLINIHYAVRVSSLSDRVKELAQELAILRAGGPADPAEDDR